VKFGSKSIAVVSVFALVTGALAYSNFTNAAVAANCLTGGSGGEATQAQNQEFTDSAGSTSRYHLYSEAAAANTSSGLLLHMHGDGAYEFENPDSGALADISEHATDHNLVMMGLLTPDSSTTTWWQNGDTNSVWVRELLQNVAFTNYNIDRSRIWLVGYSGGSQFITKFMVPDNSDLICGGGAVIFGGGGSSSLDSSFNPTFVQNFKMHWYTGQDDIGANASDGYDAYSDAQRGSATYEEAGFPVTTEHPAGVGHGGLPFGEVVGAQLDLHDVAITTAAAPATPAVGAGVAAGAGAGQVPVQPSASTQGSQTPDSGHSSSSERGQGQGSQAPQSPSAPVAPAFQPTTPTGVVPGASATGSVTPAPWFTQMPAPNQ
jgi:predicted esterase